MADNLHSKRLTIPRKSSNQPSTTIQNNKQQLFNPPQARTPKKRKVETIAPSPLKVRRLNNLQTSQTSNLNHQQPQPQIKLPLNNNPVQRDDIRSQWMDRLPSFLIYFDKTMDRAESLRYKTDCKSIGLQFTTIMDKNVTHIVIANPSTTASVQSQRNNKAMHEKFGELHNAKIWTVERFNGVMDIYFPKEKQNIKTSLAHLVQQDKLIGTQVAKPNRQFQSFKHKYLLVEEISGKYKPIYTKEYPPEEGREYPRYPKLHKKTKVPFQLASTTDNERDAAEEEEESEEDIESAVESVENCNEIQESHAHYSQDRKVYSTASGLISGSVTTLVRPGIQSAQVQRLQDKTFQPKSTTISAAHLSKDSKDPATKTKNISAFFSKPGYCENCIVKYDDFYTHVNTRTHQAWKRNPGNFTEIDDFIKKCERKPNPHYQRIIQDYTRPHQPNAKRTSAEIRDLTQLNTLCSITNQFRLGLKIQPVEAWKESAIALIQYAEQDIVFQHTSLLEANSPRELHAGLQEYFQHKVDLDNLESEEEKYENDEEEGEEIEDMDDAEIEESSIPPVIESTIESAVDKVAELPKRHSLKEEMPMQETVTFPVIEAINQLVNDNVPLPQEHQLLKEERSIQETGNPYVVEHIDRLVVNGPTRSQTYQLIKEAMSKQDIIRKRIADRTNIVESVPETSIIQKQLNSDCMCCTDRIDKPTTECSIKKGIIDAMNTGDQEMFKKFSKLWQKKIGSGMQSSMPISPDKIYDLIVDTSKVEVDIPGVQLDVPDSLKAGKKQMLIPIENDAQVEYRYVSGPIPAISYVSYCSSPSIEADDQLFSDRDDLVWESKVMIESKVDCINVESTGVLGSQVLDAISSAVDNAVVQISTNLLNESTLNQVHVENIDQVSKSLEFEGAGMSIEDGGEDVGKLNIIPAVDHNSTPEILVQSGHSQLESFLPQDSKPADQVSKVQESIEHPASFDHSLVQDLDARDTAIIDRTSPKPEFSDNSQSTLDAYAKDIAMIKSMFTMSSDADKDCSEDDIAALFNPLEKDIQMHSSHLETSESCIPAKSQPRRKLSFKFKTVESDESEDILMMEDIVQTSPLSKMKTTNIKTMNTEMIKHQKSPSPVARKIEIIKLQESQFDQNDENDESQSNIHPSLIKVDTPSRITMRSTLQETKSQDVTPKLRVMRSASRTHVPFRPTIIKPIVKLVGTPIDTTVSKRKKKEEMDRVTYLTEREYKLKSNAESRSESESNRGVGDG